MTRSVFCVFYARSSDIDAVLAFYSKDPSLLILSNSFGNNEVDK
jgi:hypothetical protein